MATVTGTFQPGQCAQLLVGKAALGTLGKVNNTVLRAHGLEQEIYLLELDLSALLDRLPAPGAFTEIPAFPPSLRDLAVLVDSTVPAGDLAFNSVAPALANAIFATTTVRVRKLPLMPELLRML